MGTDVDVVKNLENLNLNEKNPMEIGPECGLPLVEVYKLALGFYKEKVGKAFHFSYEDNLQLIAFSQQVAHGPLDEIINKLPPLGTLDVVGKDRREAWHKLGQLSKDQAKAGFVELLSRRCSLFSAYIEAHRRERDEQQRLGKEKDKKKIALEAQQQKEQENQQQEAIKRQIQQALNEQTYEQFRKYADQQYPGDPEKQGTLIRQLQEQHYIQYMQQLELSQRAEALNTEKTTENESNSSTKTAKEATVDDEVEEEEYQISSASMWTLPEVDSFKQRVAQTEGDGVVRVGHGETVTVRVPTHPHGSRLFWEFATDHYDIGFGLYFEFGPPMTEEVSVHVSDSDDEEDIEIDEEELYADETLHCDLESGGIDLSSISKPQLLEIVPVYRRDCQTEVYAGSHPYPGEGSYLLKFDNSYSLWRSKTLYYRVYYTH
ncbi:unnamed protein product [Ceutorhynchus assimilis]|uniref:Golgi resident protein GCP60 n=1 Tax=Ceutorhynchus assimilis TaxID=467358 RepID=A0A9N9QLT8_9CUCU|nr:unnamed protein product [Ceutorhynchus assimilis]